MSGLGSPGIFTMVVKMLVCLVLWNALVATQEERLVCIQLPLVEVHNLRNVQPNDSGLQHAGKRDQGRWI